MHGSEGLLKNTYLSILKSSERKDPLEEKMQ